MPEGNVTPTATLDTSNPEEWVFKFDPRANLGLSTSGKSFNAVNHREQQGDMTLNFQAYRRNPDYTAS
jgi:hypothetical protein